MSPLKVFAVIFCLFFAALDVGTWFLGRPNSGWWIAVSIVDVLLLLSTAAAVVVMG